MEFFRSPRAFVLDVGFEAALEGRAMPAGCELPKKSSPINDSCGLAGFGCEDGGAVLVG
jgi:hypothetical protein